MIVAGDMKPGSMCAGEENDGLLYLCLSVQPMGDYVRIGWIITSEGHFMFDESTYAMFDDGRGAHSYTIRTSLTLVNKGEE